MMTIEKLQDQAYKAVKVARERLDREGTWTAHWDSYHTSLMSEYQRALAYSAGVNAAKKCFPAKDFPVNQDGSF